MKFSHLTTPGNLQGTRYLVRFDQPVLCDIARRRLRMPSHGVAEWVVSAMDVYRLHEIGVTMDEWVPDDVLEEIMGFRIRAAVFSSSLAQKVGKKLYPFQELGVQFLQQTRDALLFDEMGLGKTIQALMALPDKACGIIVAPKSLLHTWAAEGKAWRPDLSFEVCDREGLRGVIPGEFIICTPNAVQIHHERKPISFQHNSAKPNSFVILDEAHYYKNSKSKRAIAITRLVTHFDVRWALTGTPLANKPPDLWGTLESIGLGSKMFGSWYRFVQTFGGSRLPDGEYVWPARSPNPKELEAAMHGRSLRRLRRIVAPEIPEKTYAIIRSTAPVCSPDDKVAVARAARAMSTGEMSNQHLGDLARLRSELAASKIPVMMEHVDQFIDTGDPLVVVSANLAPLEALAETYECPLIIGSTSTEDRAKAVEDFQAGQVKLIGIHPQAGGVGITLTAAHHMLFVQRDWSRAVNDQAEDRICRIGQRSTCVIYDIVSDHPLDERIFATLRRKAELMDTTMAVVPACV